MLQIANEANAMSEELGKNVKFEVALISGASRGDPDSRTEVSFDVFLWCASELTLLRIHNKLFELLFDIDLQLLKC